MQANENLNGEFINSFKYSLRPLTTYLLEKGCFLSEEWHLNVRNGVRNGKLLNCNLYDQN